MLLQIGGAGGQLPQWATSLIIFGSCVLVTTLVLVAGRLVHHFADRHAGDTAAVAAAVAAAAAAAINLLPCCAAHHSST
jgi:hypothetical protein